MDRNFYVAREWLALKIYKKSLAEFIRSQGIKSIAIYGMGYLGELLLEELKDSDIEVLYGIDRYAPAIMTEVDIYLPGDVLPEADAMIVTAVNAYEEIYNYYKNKFNGRIMSLEYVVYEAGI